MGKIGKINLLVGVTSALLLAVATTNLILEKMTKPNKNISSTLVPATIMVFQVMTIVYVWLLYFNHCSSTANRSLFKKSALILTILCPISILTALLIGGAKFKFKACVKVYSVELGVWIAILIGTYLYFQKMKTIDKLIQ